MSTEPIREVYNGLVLLTEVESMADYHRQSSKYLGSGKLEIFRDESPELFKKDLDGKLPKFDSVAYAQGRGAHTMILEGMDIYMETYTIGGPSNKQGEPYQRSSKAFIQWCEDEGLEAEFVLSKIDHDLNLNMLAGCQRNPDIVKILLEGEPEKVIRARYHGIDCQIRPDWIGPTHGITNLKTCRNLKYFKKDARWTFNYIASEAFYRGVAHAALSDMPEMPCTYIAVEKREPYRAGIFPISWELLDEEEEKNCEAIDRLIQCRETGVWPTLFEGHNHIERNSNV